MIDDIHLFQRKVKGLAARTRELYGEHLELLAAWLQKQGVQQWEDLTPERMEGYLEQRMETWGNSTRWNALSAARRLIRWKFGDNHPVLAVTMERTAGPPQRTLNEVQTETLLASFDTSCPKGIRDLAIVTLALDTGLRANELVSAQMNYLDMVGRVLHVPVKGSSEWEPAVFFEYTQSCMAHWLGVRSTVAKEGVKAVFVSVGGIMPGQPLTRDGLRAIFRKFSLKTDVGLVSPHDMRRTFCTMALIAGAPTRVVQVAGRWKHIKMVEHYSRALQAKAIHRYSPTNFVMGVKPKPGRGE